MKNTRNAALAFIATLSLLLLAEWLTEAGCDALSTYYFRAAELKNGSSSISFIVRITVIIGAALFVWKLLSKRLDSKRKATFGIIYFALLPLFAFYPILLRIADNIRHRELKLSVCTKSKGEFLSEVSSDRLNLKEYNYIRFNTNFLPALPASADSIYIRYAGDAFVGGFNLSVDFRCDASEKINPNADEHWGIDSNYHVAGKIKAYYFCVED